MNKLEGVIFNVQRFCVDDGPGIRSTVFLKGCPLSCLWCHNPESKKGYVQLSFNQNQCVGCRACENVCPKGVHNFSDGKHICQYDKCVACGQCVAACPVSALELIGRRATVDEVMEEVMKDVSYYTSSGGGVTISGGEPLFQPEFTLALLKECHKNGLHTCVETSGFCKESVIEEALQYTDLFLFDFKIGNVELHKKYTGVSNAPIIRNLKLLNERGSSVVLRCPIIPEINDNEEHFSYIAEYANLQCVKKVEIMPYHSMGEAKAEKIGADYLIDAPTVSHDLAVQWYEKIKSMGCQKIISP